MPTSQNAAGHGTSCRPDPSSSGTFPIDTTKTRLQIQGQAVEQALRARRYRGMLDAFLKISRQEGPTALYRG